MTPPAVPLCGVIRLIQPEGWVGSFWPCGEPIVGVEEMTIAQSAEQTLEHHVTLKLECLGGLYINGYMPMLQTDAGRPGSFAKSGATLFPHRT